MNDTGDLLDDGNVSQVKDVGGNMIYSGSKGRQGTLQEWLGSANAFTALMQPAGYEWNGTEKKWTKNPGKITHNVIEQAHKDGKLTDDQYNLIRCAAGLVAQNKKEAKASLFAQVLRDYQKAERIRTQIQIDMANRAWEWVRRKWDETFVKKDNSFLKAIKENEKIKEINNWGNNEHHCDDYCEAVLISAGKLPSDWPGTGYKVSRNDNGKRKDSFMEFYSSRLKNSPESGWNIMLMDGYTRQGKVMDPHMVVIYVRDDGLIDFSHYTSDKVVPPRIGWTVKEMTDTGKGNHDRFGYSNFKYLPLGK